MQTLHNPFEPLRRQTTVGGIRAPSFSQPWLLYAYPWMPFSRCVIIYLREKAIPEAQVTVVHVQDPGPDNDPVHPKLPPHTVIKPPALAIPATGDNAPYVYVSQPSAIMYFLEELCSDFKYGFSQPHGPMLDKPGAANPLTRARIAEIIALAEECTVAWNSVGTFCIHADIMSTPQCAEGMLRGVRRALMTIETLFCDRDISLLRHGSFGHVTIADITLYQFLEFVDGCYGVDLTQACGETVGDQVKANFPKLAELFQAFKTRDSATRDATKGEVPSGAAKQKMSMWAAALLRSGRLLLLDPETPR